MGTPQVPITTRYSSRGVWIGLGLFGLILIFILVFWRIGRPAPQSDKDLRVVADRAARSGRWSEAEEALSQLTAPNIADELNWGIVAQRLGHPEARKEHFKRLPDDGPVAAAAAVWMGRFAMEAWNSQEMERELLHALRIDPKNAEARRLLVYLYGTQGRRVELMAQFAALAEIGPLTFDLVNHWCVSHQEIINEPEKLASDLEKFVAADPADRWSRLAWATNERKLNHYDRAEELLKPLGDEDPDARALRAEIAFDRGDVNRASQLLAEGPRDHAKLARLRGRLALRSGNAKTAVAEFRRSEAIEPDHSETIYGLAQAYRLTGDSALAEAYNKRTLAQRKVRDILTNIKDNRNPKAQVCCELGDASEEAGYLAEAKAWFRLAISFDPLRTEAQQAIFRLENQLTPNR